MSHKQGLLGVVSAIAMVFCAPVSAHWCSNGCSDVASGAYVGIAGGYAQTNWSDTHFILEELGHSSVDVDDGVYGLRGFIGYDFNENFGVEVGYLHTNNSIDYKLGYTMQDVTTYLSDSIGYNAFDAVVKMRIYLDNGFSLYTKLGATYMEAQNGFKLKSALTQKSNPNNTNLTFGAGFQYCLTPCFIANLDWQHYRGSDKGEHFIADLNFFSLGIAYKWAML